MAMRYRPPKAESQVRGRKRTSRSKIKKTSSQPSTPTKCPELKPRGILSTDKLLGAFGLLGVDGICVKLVDCWGTSARFGLLFSDESDSSSSTGTLPLPDVQKAIKTEKAIKTLSENRKRSPLRSMIASLPLFMLMTLVPLVFYRVELENPMEIVSFSSLVIYTQLAFWTIFLSEVPLSDVSVALDVVVRFAFLPLAAQSMQPFAGMVFRYLSTFCGIWAWGYALANKRQRIGLEKSSASVQAKELDLVVPRVLLWLILIACCMRVVVISYRYAAVDALDAVLEISAMVFLIFLSWTCYIDSCLLHYSLFSGQVLGTLLFCSMACCIILSSVSAFLFGEEAAAVVTWFAAMAAVGLHGYTCAVYKFYRQNHLDLRNACHESDGILCCTHA